MQFVVFVLFVVLAMANAFAPIGRASNAVSNYRLKMGESA